MNNCRAEGGLAEGCAAYRRSKEGRSVVQAMLSWQNGKNETVLQRSKSDRKNEKLFFAFSFQKMDRKNHNSLKMKMDRKMKKKVSRTPQGHLTSLCPLSLSSSLASSLFSLSLSSSLLRNFFLVHGMVFPKQISVYGQGSSVSSWRYSITLCEP